MFLLRSIHHSSLRNNRLHRAISARGIAEKHFLSEMTSIEASINERHLKGELSFLSSSDEHSSQYPDFNRLLQCAAKFGDELCISANKDIVSGHFTLVCGRRAALWRAS